ncbi:ATP-binding cassette domain-containing protein [Microbulbifer halophilus]|uniref:ATP-binding cassette domain-containing protein n=1 Tax=Microbulbifer halophilus TaxID=453963 RepID=A0ABW5E7Y5_9GAMM|nr:ABC-F family ATP-binding cassette domain-containing protein [Microbulbifer halophilus]MCW8126733.1 ABC-F family ATP-binding cassette domain-containing protein [Microbulbifer halophilus]
MTSICTISQISLTLDDKPILDNLSANLPAGISGLVAPNGRGKSVLLKLLAGHWPPDSGGIDWHRPHYRLDQLARLRGPRVVDCLDADGLFDRFRRIEQGRGDEADLAAVADHWHLPALWQQQLDTAGLDCPLESPVSTLSGGQRTRLALTAAFMQRDCYLLLDEPSNHLDRQGRAWLREQLQQHPAGALVASHDRELLECAHNLFELGEKGLRQYGGNYSFYRRVRDAEIAGAEQRVENARQEIQQSERQRQKALQRAAQRQRHGRSQRGSQSKLLLDARKDRAGQSLGRVKQQFAQRSDQLQQKLGEEKSALTQQRMQQLSVTRSGLRGGPRLHLENLRLPYGRQQPISLTLHSGARWQLTGANGSGKSTLLKVISGALQPAAGHCHRHGSCLYLNQEFSLLDGDSSALDNLRRLHPDRDSTYWRTALGSLNLRGDLALRPLNTLSGGERLKVALLATTRGSRAPDLLLLDEPDNHLDLDSRRLLETALRDYPGSFLLVCHDPVFVEAVGINGELAL